MRLSKSYFFTLREDSADEETAGGNLLVRAGMVKKTSAGVYMLLPLGYKCLTKIMNIIREEMQACDSQELLMPALIAEEVYEASGRKEKLGASMFSLKDRFDRPFVLGPTHEELFAAAAKMYINSYKDLPFSLYQFQTKYRDEPRPRFGLIRVREFIMKDAYTFDVDYEGLDKAYTEMFEAYKRSFDRMGINYVIVTADTGIMGGLLSEEFQALSPIGEDVLVIDEENGYASNIEVAECPAPAGYDEKYFSLENKAEREKTIKNAEEAGYKKEHTPEARTIEEVSAFLKKDARDFMKCLIYNIDGKLYAFGIRGDHDINETKVLKLLKANEMRMAEPEEVVEASGAPVGFAGPIGLKVPLYLDYSVTDMKDFVVGANEDQHHISGVNIGDFNFECAADFRNIEEGDTSIKGGKVSFKRGIEVGNTFKLGTAYSEAMDLYFVDENNERKPVVMGSYGIGPARCMAALAEQYHNEQGLLWPKEVAPVEVYIVVINSSDEQQMQLADEVYEKLHKAGYDVILDDRDERAGVKFNDSELIGAYSRVTVGKAAKEGKVEFKCRELDDTKDMTPDELLGQLNAIFDKDSRVEL